MTISGIDLLVLVPVVPLAPVLVTWWLPWERWIPWGKIPKVVLGPYLIYAAFAAWYFEFDPWIVAMATTAGIAVSAWAIVEKVRRRKAAPPSNNQSRKKRNGS
jgi:hypothetical protein